MAQKIVQSNQDHDYDLMQLLRNTPCIPNIPNMSKAELCTGTLVYSFTWCDADKAGDNAPDSLQFDEPALHSVFGRKLDFSKPQIVHSAHIIVAYNSAPYAMVFTMNGIQGDTLVRESLSNGLQCTLTLLPNMHNEEEVEVYRFREEYMQGFVVEDDLDDALRFVPRSDMVLIRPKSYIGESLKRNEAKISETGKIEVIDEVYINMYCQSERKIVELIRIMSKKNVNELPRTDFLKHTATLVWTNTQHEHASAAADKKKHTVIVKVRFNVVDPAKLENK